MFQLIYNDKTLEHWIIKIAQNRKQQNPNQLLSNLQKLTNYSLGLMTPLLMDVITDTEGRYAVMSKEEMINCLTIIQSKLRTNQFINGVYKRKVTEVIVSKNRYFYAPRPKKLALINPRNVPMKVVLMILDTLLTFCQLGLFDKAINGCKKKKHPYEYAIMWDFYLQAMKMGNK